MLCFNNSFLSKAWCVIVSCPFSSFGWLLEFKLDEELLPEVDELTCEGLSLILLDDDGLWLLRSGQNFLTGERFDVSNKGDKEFVIYRAVHSPSACLIGIKRSPPSGRYFVGVVWGDPF